MKVKNKNYFFPTVLLGDIPKWPQRSPLQYEICPQTKFYSSKWFFYDFLRTPILKHDWFPKPKLFELSTSKCPFSANLDDKYQINVNVVVKWRAFCRKIKKRNNSLYYVENNIILQKLQPKYVEFDAEDKIVCN